MIAFLFLLLAVNPSYAQSVKIRGRIVNSWGMTLSGIPVTVPGKEAFGYTDEQGYFSFKVSRMPDSLLVSYNMPIFDSKGKQHHYARYPLQNKGKGGVYEFGFEGTYNVFFAVADPEEIFTNLGLTHNFQTIPAKILQEGNPASLTKTLNLVPGVNMEERGPGGSARLSFRGSLLRSQFGVRNIKVYFGRLPLTRPDGSTPMEMVIPDAIYSMTVFKGPGAINSGMGTGGVAVITDDLLSHYKGVRIRSSLTGGSYGQLRFLNRIALHKKSENGANEHVLVVKHLYHQLQGYRAQEANRKHQAEITGIRHYKTGEGRASAGIQLFDGYWELPGSVDSLTAANQPREANPFSESHQASLDRRWLRGFLENRYTWNNKNTLYTGAYAYATDKYNPYGTSPSFAGIKDESGKGYGGRISFSGDQKPGNWNIQYQAGLEFQSENNRITEFENNSGVEGPLVADDQVLSQRGMTEAEFRIWWKNKFSLMLGTSANLVRYRIDDLNFSDTLDYSANILYQGYLAPAAGLSYNSWNQFSVFLNTRSGYSPPTVWEIVNPGGTKNESLQPEFGRTAELGIRKVWGEARFQAEFAGYLQELQQIILPAMDSSGATFFRNGGTANMNGLEGRLMLLSKSGSSMGSNSGRINYRFALSGALNRYFFGEYQRNGQDFSGNRVTGTQPYKLSQASLVEYKLKDSKWKLGVFLSTVLNGKTPLNDENTHFQEAWSITNCKFTGTFEPSTGYSNYSVGIGVDNVFNARYSGFLQLNAFGNRFYNPAPGRFWYINLAVDLKNKRNP